MQAPEPKDKIFTRQDLSAAAERAKAILSAVAETDLTAHKPNHLSRAINDAAFTAACDDDVVAGRDIVERLIKRTAERIKEIDDSAQLAASKFVELPDMSSILREKREIAANNIYHKNNLSLAMTTFTKELALDTLYLAEKKKQKTGKNQVGG